MKHRNYFKLIGFALIVFTCTFAPVYSAASEQGGSATKTKSAGIPFEKRRQAVCNVLEASLIPDLIEIIQHYDTGNDKLNRQLLDFTNTNFDSTFNEVGKTEQERAAIVEDLLSRGANPNVENNEGDPILWLFLLENDCGQVVRTLLKHGADANAQTKQGYPMMLVPVGKGDVDGIRALLEYHADINVNKKYPCGAHGMKTMLWEAAFHNMYSVVSLLIEAGANPTVLSDGNLEMSQTLMNSVKKGLMARRKKSA